MSDLFSRTEWFRHDRFGMFIHWGLYAIPARGEWVKSTEKVSEEAYQRYFEEFDPVDYDPKLWARAAKEAGMRYAVLTAKHHDGFCLFDSKLTDYKAPNTKAGRDLVAEYVEAFRAEGLKVGLYYSLIDWHHPDYPHANDPIHPRRGDEGLTDEGRDFGRYLDYMHGQVRELCTNYGKLDVLWFDFSYGEMKGGKWKARELVEMVRSLQPEVVIDNRLEINSEGFGPILDENPPVWSGDFASPEQIIPPAGIRNRAGREIPWEACMTMNNHWGYCSADQEYKSAPVVVRKLVECVSKGGNMLLNVGPDARGRIPEESLAILAETGRWMKKNGESVVGCCGAPIEKPEWGRYTKKGNKIYAHILEAPVGALPLFGIPKGSIASIRLLSDGSERFVQNSWTTHSYPELAFTSVGPDAAFTYALPDAIDTVLEITLKEDA